LRPLLPCPLPEPLNFDFFAAGWQAVQTTDPLEVAGVLTGIVCVWLAARNSIWNFPIGIVSCGLYIVVFGRVQLYSDAGLQLAFIALAIYGWWEWLRGNAAGHPERPMLPISSTSRRQWLALGGSSVLYALGAGYLLATHTDAALPYWDSTTTAISLVAQLLLSRRKLENWLLWIGVDVAYVGMYWYRHLYLTSVLYAVFLAIAAYGYWQWRQEYRRQLTTSLIP
jgi:nicotinamide mononucleotide transporter